MNDDFNSAGAVAALFELATQANRGQDAAISAQLRALGGVLGLLQQDPGVYFQSPTRYTRRAITHAAIGQTVPAASAMSEIEIESLIQERAAAKQAKNFSVSDAIRAKLKTAGIELDDKPGGLTQWRRA
jgi:cysteinyl-tRNA synthetase